MANEWKKDFNVMLRDDKGMPKVEIVIDPNTIRKYGGKRMYFAPPLEYDRVMRQAQEGMAATLGELHAYFARASDVYKRQAHYSRSFCLHRRLGQRAAWRGWDILVESFESER